MQLIEEIQQNYNGNFAEFARRIGDHPNNVQRYAKGIVVPRPEKMALIFEATEGRVQPNDFYAKYIQRFRNLLLIHASEMAMAVAGISMEQPRRQRSTGEAA